MGKLTEIDVQAIRDGIRDGETYQSLAERFDVSRNAIWNIKHNKTHKGIGPDVQRKRVSRKLSRQKKMAICISLKMGESRESIARRLNVSVSTISAVKKESGEAKHGVDVSEISNRKLTEQDAINIRRLLKTGAKAVDLADEYGVSKAHISDIKHFKCWPNAGRVDVKPAEAAVATPEPEKLQTFEIPPRNEAASETNRDVADERYQFWEQLRTIDG
jgi:transcriptional regulator with XRE-family HTH domain